MNNSNNTVNLIETADLDGPTNMALDEVLWHEAAHGVSFLRFYGWSPRPTISLGYFQRIDEIRRHSEWRTLPLVRRLTGGGAIVHDDEITYAIALSSSAAPTTSELYDRVHRAIQSALRALNIPAELGTNRDADSRSAVDTMCFRRSDRFAVCVHGQKVVGSAQRRGAASVLMHGSVLLGRSLAAPTICGLSELLGRRVDDELIRDSLARAIPRSLDLAATPTTISNSLFERACRLATEEYANTAWTERRLGDRWPRPAAIGKYANAHDADRTQVGPVAEGSESRYS